MIDGLTTWGDCLGYDDAPRPVRLSADLDVWMRLIEMGLFPTDHRHP